MNFKRIMIGENVGFSSIIDKKFNTCNIYIRFIMDIAVETAANNLIAIGVISTSNSRLKTLAILNEKLSELYGASLSTFSHKKGDIQVIGLSSSWICNRFALYNEDITCGVLKVIHDCVFAPNANNDIFDLESFQINKKNLIDRIDAEFNDKRSYVISKAEEIAFRGEPAENQCFGTKKSAEVITAESAYAAYLKLMKSARVEITYIAPERNNSIVEMFSNCFSKIKRISCDYVFNSKSPIKLKVENVSEEVDVCQSKIVLIFKSQSMDLAALKIFSVIFGETPVSKLFINVREKLSLCYYCACRFNQFKNSIMVDCGVEKCNIEKATTEILKQLDEMVKGNITNEEIEAALLTIENSLITIGDTPVSYSNWYFNQLCTGISMTPEEKLEVYRSVIKERIIAAAETIKLDSTYFMLSK